MVKEVFVVEYDDEANEISIRGCGSDEVNIDYDIYCSIILDGCVDAISVVANTIGNIEARRLLVNNIIRGINDACGLNDSTVSDLMS